MTAGRFSIDRVIGRQILDSRGRPTVEVDVMLQDGTLGRACAPSGASTGRHEAWELRDGDAQVYEGLGVLKAVDNVNGVIARCLAGHDVLDQRGLDRKLAEEDGSPSLKTLGANAILATSLAACRAGAQAGGQPLHRRIAELAGNRTMTMPMPMTNILSGGAHAGRGMDLQDFLAMPVGARDYAEALDMISRVRSSAARLMERQGLSVLLADEGGLSPGFAEAEQALELMVKAIESANLRPGEDVAIALDVAGSELFEDGRYRLARSGRLLSPAEMTDYIVSLVKAWPIISVEDALDQDDWAGWRDITVAIGDIQIVGDDLFVTNEARILKGITEGVGNAVLIKVNQNGTLSGTLAAMEAAWSAGYGTVVSARSGETEDSFIADLAVGTGAGQIKIGSVRNSERLAKYNQLLRIGEEKDIAFAGAPRHAARGDVAPQQRIAS